MLLKLGCPGCDRHWNAPDAEGQCSRCKRCLACCGNAKVTRSCAAVAANMPISRRGASTRAYQQWLSNPAILGHNRRIV